jgi:hypothetical protein
MTTASSGPHTLQFRLGTALITMIAVGVACAALARPTPFWAGALLSFALLSLLVALLLAIYRSGSAQAFALGYLIFGSGYLAATVLLDRSLHTMDDETGMPTSRAALWVYWQTHAQNRQAVTLAPGNFGGPGKMGGGAAGMPPAPAVMQVPLFRAERFVEVVHSVLIVLLGVAGGLLGRFLYLTARQPARDDDRRELEE